MHVVEVMCMFQAVTHSVYRMFGSMHVAEVMCMFQAVTHTVYSMLPCLQVDGLSLLCACLRYWLRKGKGCPHVFVSTHFHQLLQQPLLPTSPLLDFLVSLGIECKLHLICFFKMTYSVACVCDMDTWIGFPM